jgi:hypothetical protein
MNIYWNSSIGVGSFTNSASWVQSAVPGESDIAEMTRAADIIVDSVSPVTVLGVNIGSGATLDIPTNFTATEGTPNGANRGTIEVISGAELIVGGTLNNSGTVSVGSGTLAVQDFDLTVKGGGVVDLGGAGAGIFVGAGHSLSNINNTIAISTIPFRAKARSLIPGPWSINRAASSPPVIAVARSSSTLQRETRERSKPSPQALCRSMLRPSTIRVAALSGPRRRQSWASALTQPSSAAL